MTAFALPTSHWDESASPAASSQRRRWPVPVPDVGSSRHTALRGRGAGLPRALNHSHDCRREKAAPVAAAAWSAARRGQDGGRRGPPEARVTERDFLPVSAP